MGREGRDGRWLTVAKDSIVTVNNDGVRVKSPGGVINVVPGIPPVNY